MSKIYCPNENLPRDELMILWRDRLIFTQYINNKRPKYRLKLHELCGSTGIILQTSIYSDVYFPDPHDLGQTDAILMSLLIDIIGKGYTVYVENYYNFVQFTQQLSSDKIYICGTLRSDRKDNLKGKIWRRAGTESVCKWRDRRDVFNHYQQAFCKDS